MAEQRSHRKPKRHTDTSLLLVQSAVCGVILLIALITRLIGGSFYEELRRTFRDALTDSGIADTVSAWLASESKDG